MKQLGVLSIIIIGMCISIPLGGWILMSLWGWFIVPTLQLPALSYTKAIGLGFFLSYVISATVKNDNDDMEYSEAVEQVIKRGIIVPLFFMFVGWIIHLIIS